MENIVTKRQCFNLQLPFIRTKGVLYVFLNSGRNLAMISEIKTCVD